MCVFVISLQSKQKQGGWRVAVTRVCVTLSWKEEDHNTLPNDLSVCPDQRVAGDGGAAHFDAGVVSRWSSPEKQTLTSLTFDSFISKAAQQFLTLVISGFDFWKDAQFVFVSWIRGSFFLSFIRHTGLSERSMRMEEMSRAVSRIFCYKRFDDGGALRCTLARTQRNMQSNQFIFWRSPD